jgi:hypothetical protein
MSVGESMVGSTVSRVEISFNQGFAGGEGSGVENAARVVTV